MVKINEKNKRVSSRYVILGLYGLSVFCVGFTVSIYSLTSDIITGRGFSWYGVWFILCLILGVCFIDKPRLGRRKIRTGNSLDGK